MLNFPRCREASHKDDVRAMCFRFMFYLFFFVPIDKVRCPKTVRVQHLRGFQKVERSEQSNKKRCRRIDTKRTWRRNGILLKGGLKKHVQRSRERMHVSKGTENGEHRLLPTMRYCFVFVLFFPTVIGSWKFFPGTKTYL